MEKHELVDKNGNNTGKVLTYIELRNIENIPDGNFLSVVGVVILNDNNEILLQKRAKIKRINPGKWGICGGKVNFGESTIEAGVRETFEEIGININEKNLKLLSKNIVDKVYFTVYYINENVNLNKCILQKEEVDEVKYFKIDELENLDNEGFEWLDDLKKIYKS